MAREVTGKNQRLYVGDLYAETFQLLRPVWDDVVASAQMAGRRGNTDPAWTQLGSSGLYLPGFSASASNEIFFSFQVPHGNAHGIEFNNSFDRQGYAANEMRLYIHWIPSTTNTGNCLWKLEYWVSNRDTAYADDDVATTSAIDAASGTVTEQVTYLSAIPATGFKDSTCVVCRLYRDGGDITDTFTGVALAVSISAHIQIYKIGSIAENGGS